MPVYNTLNLTPEEFELYVKGTLDRLSLGLVDYRSTHRELIAGSDGEYEIDITIRFSALGVAFLVLVECKRYSKPVGREKVQAHLSKMQSVGAQKGIIFSTSGFQSGASEFAAAHGIALVEVLDGRTSYLRRSFDDRPIPWEQVPDYISRIVGWLHNGDTRSIVDVRHFEALRDFLCRAEGP